jgi:putative Mn2+ efflux pump MntP
MTPPDPTPRRPRGESMLAFSIMFFCIALLCFMLGWADGVRHDRAYLHIPETGSWLVATAVLAALGVIFLVWSRAGRQRP